MHKQHINGHTVYYDWKEKCFKYCDTHEQANYVRPCPVCGKFPEKWMKIFNERYKLLVEFGELGDILRTFNYIDEIVVD